MKRNLFRGATASVWTAGVVSMAGITTALAHPGHGAGEHNHILEILLVGGIAIGAIAAVLAVLRLIMRAKIKA